MNDKKVYSAVKIRNISLIEKQIVKNSLRSVKEGQSFSYKETNAMLTKVAYKPYIKKV